MDNSKKYNLGLDIGVASVGWAVTDENGDLLKRQGRNLWGSRLFEEANTAEIRRAFRSARRRIERRKERINMLQSLLQEDMEELYPNFFQRLRNSSLIYSDKDNNIFNENYNLFDEKYFNDESYYATFPTIYHLRRFLSQKTEKVDFRLVYLALHHIIKYRGNFLYEGNVNDNIQEIEKDFISFTEFLARVHEIVLEEGAIPKITNVLKSKSFSKKEKIDEIKKYFYFDFEKEKKSVLENALKGLVGYKFDVSKVFDLNGENKISLSSEIEKEDEIIEMLKEESEVYIAMKNIYNWFILQSILDIEEGEKDFTISKAYIAKYEKHKRDLQILKRIYKEYYPSEYNDMFRKELPNNYVSFRGKALKKDKSKEDTLENFYKKIKNKIAGLPDSCAEKKEIIIEIENDTFLRKLNTTDNGAIPHQLHMVELERIIDNQSPYYKTLRENKDKILKIFEYRIPYYVGPLAIGKGSDFAWVKRKSNEKIRPWNIEEIIDKDLTAEEFIKRMTNKCTYLLNKDVIPKNSLLYSKFCVLNELCNIRIITGDRSNVHLDAKTKKGIINNLFLERKKVTKKDIINYLNNNGIPCESISGLSDGNNFNSNLAPYIDMKKLFSEDYTLNDYEMYETLIYLITIFEDKKLLKEKIERTYPQIQKETIKKLVNLKYSGWSRLSKELLVDIKSNQGDSIMDLLESSKMNFMQIITNPELGFDRIIEKQLYKGPHKINYKEDIKPIPTSPANKRAIWQAIGIVNEITKVMGREPENIYIEFARSEEEKKMKDSRLEKLVKLYEKFIERNEKVYTELKRAQSERTKLGEKMYLYFMQNGKCMYSAKPLELEELDKYEVDHIIPQSYIKDDSFDNKALVIREQNQRKKDSLLLEDHIINSRTEEWKLLLDNGLISQSKYFRLIKRNMLETESQKIDFVNRQLVETRQITKYVTNLLKNNYKDTEIYAIRAGVVSNIRSKYKLYKNRDVNDYHHAHDAYLLCTVGNIIEQKLKYKDEFQYGEYVKKYFKESSENKDTTKNAYGVLIGLISKYIEPEKLKRVLAYKDCYLSRKLEEGTGEFYNQTIYKKRKELIPRKGNLPTEIYGGYSSEKRAYLCIYSYKTSNGKEKCQLTYVPVKIACDIKNKMLTLEEYIKASELKNEKYTEIKILKEKMLLNQLFVDKEQNFIRLCSEQEIKVEKQLILEEKMNKYLNIMNGDAKKRTEDEEKFINDYAETMYLKLLEKIQAEYPIYREAADKLMNKKEKYVSIDNNEKKKVINEIIKMIKVGYGDLSLLGFGSRYGRQNGKKYSEKKLEDMTFIDKSITGIYERRYKIYGVENNTSK